MLHALVKPKRERYKGMVKFLSWKPGSAADTVAFARSPRVAKAKMKSALEASSTIAVASPRPTGIPGPRHGDDGDHDAEDIQVMDLFSAVTRK